MNEDYYLTNERDNKYEILDNADSIDIAYIDTLLLQLYNVKSSIENLSIINSSMGKIVYPKFKSSKQENVKLQNNVIMPLEPFIRNKSEALGNDADAGALTIIYNNLYNTVNLVYNQIRPFDNYEVDFADYYIKYREAENHAFSDDPQSIYIYDSYKQLINSLLNLDGEIKREGNSYTYERWPEGTITICDGKVTKISTDDSVYYYNGDSIPCAKLFRNNNIYVNFKEPYLNIDELSIDGIAYYRFNPQTGELGPIGIGIFDEENIALNQYGGNQNDFQNHFAELIRDPMIWEEMQKCYPVDLFPSIDNAMEYYESYFDGLAGTGCGYVAATNLIFEKYKGKEREFEKTFGFPMYTVDQNGNIDFNYELMTLKYYNHCWNDEFVSKIKFSPYIDAAFASLLGKPIMSVDYYAQGDTGTHTYEKLESFLKNYGVSCTVHQKYYNQSDGDSVNNKILQDLAQKEVTYIIEVRGWDLYGIKNGNTSQLEWENIVGHAMYVTGFTDDGYPIVSTWGEQKVIDITSKSYEDGFFRVNIIEIDV